MKKQFFLATLFAFMALFSMAQTPTLLPLDIDTNTITTHSFYIPAQAFGGGGTWYVEPQVKKVNTSTWIPGDTGMYTGTGMSFSVMKDSLLANTDYLPRLVVYNSALVQVAIVTYPTVRTKPDPEPVTIGSAFSVPMLPNSGLRFTGASSVGQQAFALGYPMTGGAPVTDTVFFGFTNSFSDTLVFLVDGPNFFHPSTRVVIQGLSDGSVASSAVIPAFYSPAYTAGTMSIGTPFLTKDSINVNLNITSLGNAGNSMLEIMITDTLGPVVYQSLQIVTTTGPIVISKGTLSSNHYYRITALLTNPVNMTTISTKVFKTLNVDPSTVTVAQQLPQDYVSYTVKSFITPKGSGDSSKAVKAELLEANVVVDSMMLALTDTGTITFTQTGQTSGTSKSVKVRVTNGANLVTTSSSVNVSMLAVGTPIMNPTASVKTIDSIYVGFNVTSLGIPLNPTFHVVIKNQLGITILDSTRLVTQTGIIGIGKGGLVSNNTYTVTSTLVNTMMLGDTDVVVITTNSIIITPNATPHITDLLADGPATVRVTSISYGASANNTSTIRLIFKILQAGYVDTVTVVPGLMGSGIIPSFTIDNCIGGYTTEVTVIDESPAGIKVGNTLQQNMPLPSDVMIGGIVQGQVSTTATTLGIHIFGSGEGNASPMLKLWLYQNNVQIGSVFSTVVNSGMFDYEYVWDNLQPSTEYKVIAEISATGSATSSTFGFFYTDAMSGIREILQIPETQIVQVSNLMGQLVTKGEYKTVRASLVGSQALLFFTPIGDDGLPSGTTRKLFAH